MMGLDRLAQVRALFPEIFPSLYHRFVGLMYCKKQSIILQNELCHSLRLVLVDHEEDDWGKGHPELRSHMMLITRN